MTKAEALKETHARAAKESLIPGLSDRQAMRMNEVHQGRRRLMDDLEAAQNRGIFASIWNAIRLARAWSQLNGS